MGEIRLTTTTMTDRKNKPDKAGHLFAICHSSLIGHSSFVRCHSVSRSGRTSWPRVATHFDGADHCRCRRSHFLARCRPGQLRTGRNKSTAQLEKVGKDLRDAFIDIARLQPRVTINNRVYPEQTTPVSGAGCLVTAHRSRTRVPPYLGGQFEARKARYGRIRSHSRLRSAGATCRSISARMKSSSSCRTPGSLGVEQDQVGRARRLKMDCGTAFQGRICKANYPRCCTSACTRKAPEQESDLPARNRERVAAADRATRPSRAATAADFTKAERRTRNQEMPNHESNDEARND